MLIHVSYLIGVNAITLSKLRFYMITDSMSLLSWYQKSEAGLKNECFKRIYIYLSYNYFYSVWSNYN